MWEIYVVSLRTSGIASEETTVLRELCGPSEEWKRIQQAAQGGSGILAPDQGRKQTSMESAETQDTQSTVQSTQHLHLQSHRVE